MVKEYMNRDMLIPFGVRLAVIPAMLWLGAGEQSRQAAEPGLNLLLPLLLDARRIPVAQGAMIKHFAANLRISLNGRMYNPA